MATTVTHTQVRTIEAGPVFRTVDTVTAATNIDKEVFLFLTDDESFQNVCDVADMSYPASLLAAQQAGATNYRLATVTKDYDDLDVAIDFSESLTSRLQSLVVAYQAATATFVGTDTDEVITS